MATTTVSSPSAGQGGAPSRRVFSRRVAPFAPVALAVAMQAFSPSTAAHKPPAAGHGAAARAKAAACQPDLASCPDNGCAAPDSDHAIANQLKRRRLAEEGVQATLLTFDDLHQLQDEAIKQVGDTAGDITADQRAQLHNLQLASQSGQVSEGDLVQVMGFLVGTPHANTGESVNCGLTGEENNDFHIPVADAAQSSFGSFKEAEFSAIVVEMIPQDRPAEWSLAQLASQRDDEHAVLITGQLFYDNLHHPNGDSSHPLSGQPRRFALWEIHPVTSLKVCMAPSNDCTADKPDGWVPLEQVKTTPESGPV